MDVGAWEGLFVQVAPEDSKARGWLDLHGRRDGARFTGIIRPAFGYAFHPSLTAYVGYALVPSIVPGEGSSVEHRIWQQAIGSWSVSGARFALRPRLEQRLASGIEGLGLRVRLFGRAQIPVPPYEPLSLVLWDEGFFALNRSGFLPPGFDQNRLFVGPALSSGPLRAEVGVLAQHLLREAQWSAVGVAATNLFVSF